MSAIYFPLRSNAGWFTSEETHAALAQRIKNALVLYDRIVVQDGRYKLLVLETGQFDFYMPPAMYPADRSLISYFETGGKAAFRINHPETGESLPILEGPTVAGYDVDFYPILEEGGLLDVDYVVRGAHDLTDEVKAHFKKQLKEDLASERLLDRLPGNQFQKQKLVETTYHDTTLAHLLSLPFSADHRVAGFVAWKNGRIGEHVMKPAFRDVALGTLTSIMLPDFGELDWAKVVEVRESAAGRDLRRMITEISLELVAIADEVESTRDIEDVVKKHLLAELIKEIQRSGPSKARIALDLGLNLIPYAGFVGPTVDIMEMVERNRSWMSLIRR